MTMSRRANQFQARMSAHTPLQALKSGPIAVAVYVDDAFMSYGGGIFTSTTCNPAGTNDVNHAVLVVGSGVDPDLKKPYWLVRGAICSWRWCRRTADTFCSAMCNV
jgi:hypothetical protein